MNINKSISRRNGRRTTDSIRCQILAITGMFTSAGSREGFDLRELRTVSAAFCQASLAIEQEIERLSPRRRMAGRGRCIMNVLPFRPYRPDPRNGTVYATEIWRTTFVGDAEIETPDGFAVIHMSSGGGSAGIHRFNNVKDAEAALVRIARKYNAVLT
jgi:hypothetical protein